MSENVKNKAVCIYIKKRKIELNMTTAQFAEKLGIAAKTLQGLESGYRAPSVKMIGKFKQENPKCDTNRFFI